MSGESLVTLGMVPSSGDSLVTLGMGSREIPTPPITVAAPRGHGVVDESEAIILENYLKQFDIEKELEVIDLRPLIKKPKLDSEEIWDRIKVDENLAAELTSAANRKFWGKMKSEIKEDFTKQEPEKEIVYIMADMPEPKKIVVYKKAEPDYTPMVVGVGIALAAGIVIGLLSSSKKNHKKKRINKKNRRRRRRNR